jgi:hypothetical protein
MALRGGCAVRAAPGEVAAHEHALGRLALDSDIVSVQQEEVAARGRLEPNVGVV